MYRLQIYISVVHNFAKATSFSARYSDNLSLTCSTEKTYSQVTSRSIIDFINSILPIPKIPAPLTTSDYRPISITPILSQMLERIVVTYFIPSLQSAPPDLSFLDQFAFQPTASTTVALYIFVY